MNRDEEFPPGSPSEIKDESANPKPVTSENRPAADVPAEESAGKTLFGAYLEEARTAQKMRRADLARAVGYKNISKGVRRIEMVERGETTGVGRLRKAVQVLGLDEEKAEALIAEDRRRELEAWNAWADEPQKPSLMIRPMAAVWIRQQLPEGSTQREMIAAARKASRMTRDAQAVLITGRRFHLFFDQGDLIGWVEKRPDGEPVPHMKIGSQPFVFQVKEPG